MDEIEVIIEAKKSVNAKEDPRRLIRIPLTDELDEKGHPKVELIMPESKGTWLTRKRVKESVINSTS